MRIVQRRALAWLAALVGVSSMVATVEVPVAGAQRAVRRTVQASTQRRLRSFGTSEALRAYVQRLLAARRADERRIVRRARRASGGGYGTGSGAQRPRDGGGGGSIDSLMSGALGGGSPAPSRPAADPRAPAATAAGTSQAPAADQSITNTQEVGIDEGDIVKVRGDHLVVLRRGRLFTVSLAGNRMQPISVVNAFPPGANDSEAWYDEMLVDGNKIVVIGFSYETSATELGMFDLDDAGRITHRATYYLRSNDYYSSRNYASRLIGHTLILYMPYSLFFEQWDEESERATVTPSFPAMRRWRARGRDDWHQIVTASEVFQPIQPTSQPVLHTVVTCDLSQPNLRCRARGVVGPYGRTFYVSHEAVYVWVTSDEAETVWYEEEYDENGELVERDRPPAPPPPGVVYRLPLAGGAPGALRVFGAPTDQLSLRAADGHLNALLTSEGNGDAMWASERSAGGVALLRVPIARIRPNAPVARREDYTVLPSVERRGALQNRFVGDQHVLYGVGGGWGPRVARRGPIFVHRYGANAATTTLELPHGTDRIEPMGAAAVAVGSDGRDLHFTAIRLAAPQAQIAGNYVERAASQGEERTHGFFYLPTSDSTGYLGLPVRGGRESGARHLRDTSASVLFLSVDDLRFAPLGSLASRAPANVADACIASCVDWYGNARPIFYRDRVYALLGYELVEGRIDARAIREIGRTDMLTLVNQPVARAGN